MSVKYLIHMSAGQGPDECALAVAKLVPIILKSALKYDLQATLVDTVPGNRSHTYKSAIIEIEGSAMDSFKKEWEGTIQWSCESPYRIGHKRKNWFISLKFIDAFTETEFNFNKSDLKIEAMKASGPGGQHVNKTNSAIKITHIPTGISVVSQNTPSQHQNKQIALINLQDKIIQMSNNQNNAQLKSLWENHAETVRGNSVKKFYSDKFIQK